MNPLVWLVRKIRKPIVVYTTPLDAGFTAKRKAYLEVNEWCKENLDDGMWEWGEPEIVWPKTGDSGPTRVWPRVLVLWSKSDALAYKLRFK